MRLNVMGEKRCYFKTGWSGKAWGHIISVKDMKEQVSRIAGKSMCQGREQPSASAGKLGLLRTDKAQYRRSATNTAEKLYRKSWRGRQLRAARAGTNLGMTNSKASVFPSTFLRSMQSMSTKLRQSQNKFFSKKKTRLEWNKPTSDWQQFWDWAACGLQTIGL